MEARGRKTSYDPIIRLHFVELEKEKENKIKREKNSEKGERGRKGTKEETWWCRIHVFFYRYIQDKVYIFILEMRLVERYVRWYMMSCGMEKLLNRGWVQGNALDMVFDI